MTVVLGCERVQVLVGCVVHLLCVSIFSSFEELIHEAEA